MINIFQPSLGGKELNKIKEVFDSNWLGRGDVVHEFEAKFAENLSSNKDNFCIGVNMDRIIYLEIMQCRVQKQFCVCNCRYCCTYIHTHIHTYIRRGECSPRLVTKPN